MGNMKVIIRHKHKCKKIAEAPNMGKGRKWWVGKLIKLVEKYPNETHCLHLKTPVKEVTFLCNSADFNALTILAGAVNGKINEDWLISMINIAKNK